jgi:hypothetical protein
VTWLIEGQDAGTCLLTVTHDQLDDSPKTADAVSGQGWMFVLSGMKTLLETGAPMTPGGRRRFVRVRRLRGSVLGRDLGLTAWSDSKSKITPGSLRLVSW